MDVRRELLCLGALLSATTGLAAGGTVTGRVVDAKGKPIPNVEVDFFDADHSWLSFVASVKTDGAGRYRYTMPTPEDQPPCVPKDIEVFGTTYKDSRHCTPLEGKNTKLWQAGAFLPVKFQGGTFCAELDPVQEGKFGQYDNAVRDFRSPKEVWGLVLPDFYVSGFTPRAKWTVKVRLTPRGPTWSGNRATVEETMTTDDVRSGLAVFQGMWAPLGQYDVRMWLVEPGGKLREVAVAARLNQGSTAINELKYGSYGPTTVTKFFQRKTCREGIVFSFGARAK